MGRDVVTSCEVGPATVSAIGTARFRSWTPLTPDFEFELSALAVTEIAP